MVLNVLLFRRCAFVLNGVRGRLLIGRVMILVLTGLLSLSVSVLLRRLLGMLSRRVSRCGLCRR